MLNIVITIKKMMSKSKSNQISWQTLGLYGGTIYRTVGKTKPLRNWKLNQQFRSKYKNNECARTVGLVFKGGVIDWTCWCSCKLKCGFQWNYEWLMHLRMVFLNRTKEQQHTTFASLIIKGDKYQYYLMDSYKNKHLVCCQFFCKVYQISPTTLLKLMDEIASQSITLAPIKTVGKWDRDIAWTKKVDSESMKNWIETQPKHFSHYSRHLDRRSKMHFTDITTLEQLYNKYCLDMDQKNIKKMSLSSFCRIFKVHFKKRFGFGKSHLDVCQTCTRIQTISKKVANNKDLRESPLSIKVTFKVATS